MSRAAASLQAATSAPTLCHSTNPPTKLTTADEDTRAAAAKQRAAADPRACLLGVEELMELFESRAAEAAAEAEARGIDRVRVAIGCSYWVWLLGVAIACGYCVYCLRRRSGEGLVWRVAVLRPALGLAPAGCLNAALLACLCCRLRSLQASRGERLVVGLTGYPNVGKSSTINALFGSKKTAVAPTPGKTKHFQVCVCVGGRGGGCGGSGDVSVVPQQMRGGGV